MKEKKHYLMKKTSVDAKGVYRYSKKFNTSYIDIIIDSYTELYNEWDFSPYANRDIDEDLYEYLEEAAFEIDKRHEICIVFNIPKLLKNRKKEKESRIGFFNYFAYELRKESNKRRIMVRKATYYGVFGLLLLFVGTWANILLDENGNYNYLTFLTEGLFVGGWVLSWELFNIIFFELGEFSERTKILKRLRDAKIRYNYR